MDVCEVVRQKTTDTAMVLLGLFVVVVCIGVYWVNRQKGYTIWSRKIINEDDLPNLLPQNSLVSEEPLELYIPASKKGLVAIPIEYSKIDFGFVAKIRVGSSYVFAVLDTGSFDLTVGTTECHASSMCSAHDASYDLTNSPTAQRTGLTKTLRYASLTIEAEVVHDSVGLISCAASECLEPVDTNRSLSQMEGMQELLPMTLKLYAASKMHGTASNVMGLMHPDIDGIKDSFLDRVFDMYDLDRQWTFYGSSRGRGALVLGKLCGPQFGTPSWFPLSKSFRYSGAYIIEIEQCTIGSTKIPVKYLLLDTGTHESFFSGSVHKEVAASGLPLAASQCSNKDLPTVMICLSRDVCLEFSPEGYIRNSRGVCSSTFHVSHPKVDEMFKDVPVLLFGITHMMDLAWTFDLARHRVGVSPIL